MAKKLMMLAVTARRAVRNLALFTAFAAATVAWGEEEKVGGYTWWYWFPANGDTAEVIDASQFEGAMTIPDILGGKPVTSIQGEAFESRPELTSVTIPNSVTSIGSAAFAYCSGLTSVTIPGGLKEIGIRAFYNCSGLTSVTIPGSVTSAGWEVFMGCSGLTSVTIGNGLTSIWYSMFYDCSGLTSVTIPSSVTNIDDYAFSGCSGLTSVTIPNSVTSLGESAFSGCRGLTSVTLPEGVTSIGDYAFSGCRYLETISIPKTLTSIGADAFAGAFSFTTVYVANTSEISRVKQLFEAAGIDTSDRKFIVKGTKNCTITFNANGGTCSTTTRTVASGATVGELPRTTRTGYTLIGWFTAASGGTQVTASTKVTANVTFHAQWKENAAPAQTYVVRLHRNNSDRDGATAGRTYTIGKARSLPKIRNELKWAPRKGYDFLGWSRSATATTATYTDGQSLKDLTKTAGAEVHLYGVWKAHKYIVRLHRNNSKNDGATTGRAFDYDQVRFLPTMAELKWVRSGYMFLGWSQAQNSSTVKYADGLNVYNLSPNDGEELHVWGVWKKADAGAYLLRLHRNNSERDGATAGRQLKLNASRKLPTAKELGWSRKDATFKGWATTAKNAAAGKVTYKDGATVKNLVKTLGDTAHLYAVWQ